jgi:large subunit ribosomal protein L10
LAISKARKDELVALYVDMLENSKAVFLADYSGMKVQTMEQLRQQVREVDGAMFVTKNTLLQIALEQVGKPVPTDLLNGQIITGFALGEVPTLAKALTDFAKKEDALNLRGAVFSGEILNEDQVKALAELPTLDELRGTLVGMISAPARNVAMVVASGVRQVVNVLDAYAKKEEAEAAA